jgi:fumarate hydratase class II
MLAVQVMANDVAVGFGGAGGYLEMNVYKPLMIHNISQSIALLADGCTNFRRFLVEDTRPNRKKIAEDVQRSLMLVTALAPIIGFVSEEEFDRVVDPAKMVRPYVAVAT